MYVSAAAILKTNKGGDVDASGAAVFVMHFVPKSFILNCDARPILAVTFPHMTQRQ